MSIVLTPTDLAKLTDAKSVQGQIEQLEEWGIPYQLTLAGAVKVIKADLSFAGQEKEKMPNLEAANNG